MEEITIVKGITGSMMWWYFTFLEGICADVVFDDPSADKSCLILYDPWGHDNFPHCRSCIQLIKLKYSMLIASNRKIKHITVPSKEY